MYERVLDRLGQYMTFDWHRHGDETLGAVAPQASILDQSRVALINFLWQQGRCLSRPDGLRASKSTEGCPNFYDSLRADGQLSCVCGVVDDDAFT